MNKKILVRVISGILVIAIMLLIYLFSAQNGEQSSGVSGKIANCIMENIVRPINIQDEQVNDFINQNLGFIIRKLAHFSIYTALGICLTVFVLTFDEIKKMKRYIIPFTIGATYAVTDEIHQLFSDGRSGQVTDVLLDSLGVITGILVIFLIQRYIEKRNRKEEKETAI